MSDNNVYDSDLDFEGGLFTDCLFSECFSSECAASDASLYIPFFFLMVRVPLHDPYY